MFFHHTRGMTFSLSVPVGRDHSLETWTLEPGFRTAAQMEAIRSIVESDAFDFSSTAGATVFQGEGTLYQGAMTFLWYGKDAKLRATRISKLGRVLREVTAP